MARSGQVNVYVDVSDVLDEIDTEDLRDELKSRLGKGDDAGCEPLPGEFTEHDIATLRYFVERGMAHDLLSLMASCMGLNRPPITRKPINAAAPTASAHA